MVDVTDAPGSATIYGVPHSHQDSYLSSFDWEVGKIENGDVQRRAQQFLDHLSAHAEGKITRPPHLIMHGPAGLGKTHLAVGFYRWAVMKTDQRRCRFIQVPQFCDKVKRSFDEGGDPFRDASDVDFLIVLDDLFGRELTSWEVNNVITRLVGVAYRNDAALIVTQNPDLDEMMDLLMEHEMSRVLQNADVWEFAGRDQRWQT